MKKIIFILMALIISSYFFSCKSNKEELSLYLYSPIGTVTILSAGTQKTPKDGDFLSIGDSVRTGPLSSADILLGNIGIVRVYENSLVHIESLIDPVTGVTKINMDQGKLYSTLEKLKRGSFQVKTPTSVASIRGTSFRIIAAQNESRLDVLDGKVHINPVQNNTVIEHVKNFVEANQTVRIDKATVIDAIMNKKKIKVSALNPDDIKKIREEIKTLKPVLMKKMRDESRKKLEKKIHDAKEKIRKAKEQYKLNLEQFKKDKKQIAEKLKEKQREIKEKQKAVGKMSLKEKLEMLQKQRAAAAQRKAAQKKKPAGNLSL